MPPMRKPPIFSGKKEVKVYLEIGNVWQTLGTQTKKKNEEELPMAGHSTGTEANRTETFIFRFYI